MHRPDPLILDIVRQYRKDKMRAKKKLLCYSKDDFVKLMVTNGWRDNTLPDDVAIISIGTPEDYYGNEGNHWFKEHHDNVLNIDFFDVDFFEFFERLAHKEDGKNLSIYSTYERTYIKEEGEDNTSYIYECFNHEQAEEVVKFILANIGKDFYIHCYAGQSRSQAIALFILTHFNKYYDYTSLNKKNLPGVPNQWVLDCLNNVYTENKKEFMEKDEQHETR